MSAGVEGTKRLDVRPRPLDRPEECTPTLTVTSDDTPREPDPTIPIPDPDPQDEAAVDEEPVHDTPLLIDAHEDRWAWRRRIRRNPRKLFFYRICVAVLGLLLLILAAITGPLPGPGGIPIALLAIAVWSSEFEWAQRLMLWFRSLLKRYQALPTRTRRFLNFLAVLGALGGVYIALIRFGVPPWMPEFLAHLLRHLPGV